MKLPFLNRTEELFRLQKAFNAANSTLVCLYGRRRCGKSRLLQKALKNMVHVYYVGDERESGLQRQALAKEISRILSGFDKVQYSSWDDLFERWYKDAPSGAVLAIDEFPFLVATSPELPAVLQKYIDRESEKKLHCALCGSSQRMMYGLVLDASAPLFGRAREIMKVAPLSVTYLHKAMSCKSAETAIEAFSVWGGVPRYWELAMEYDSLMESVKDLVLNPLSVLFHEPERLLSDQLRDIRQSASLLSVIGQGCNRLSEIAGRMGKPATSLTRPLSVLLELGLVRREIPFGSTVRDSKRSLYKIADPFLRFWLKYVEPNRSLLESGNTSAVVDSMKHSLPMHIADIWEDLARNSVAHLSINTRQWGVASRYWGNALGGGIVEIDIVAESLENKSDVLVGEAKHTCTVKEVPRLLKELHSKAARCPVLKGKNIHSTLWILKPPKGVPGILSGDDVIEAMG